MPPSGPARRKHLANGRKAYSNPVTEYFYSYPS